MGIAATVGAGAASAEHIDPGCYRGDYCMYKDANWGGGIIGTPGNIWTYTIYNYFNCNSACGLNDSVSSASNNGIWVAPDVAVAWKDYGDGGPWLWYLMPGDALSYVGSANNDMASSNNWMSQRPCC
jgi:hypothetical protein